MDWIRRKHDSGDSEEVIGGSKGGARIDISSTTGKEVIVVLLNKPSLVYFYTSLSFLKTFLLLFSLSFYFIPLNFFLFVLLKLSSSNLPLIPFHKTFSSVSHLQLGKPFCLVAGHLSIDELGEQKLLELRPKWDDSRGGQGRTKGGDIGSCCNADFIPGK